MLFLPPAQHTQQHTQHSTHSTAWHSLKHAGHKASTATSGISPLAGLCARDANTRNTQGLGARTGSRGLETHGARPRGRRRGGKPGKSKCDKWRSSAISGLTLRPGGGIEGFAGALRVFQGSRSPVVLVRTPPATLRRHHPRKMEIAYSGSPLPRRPLCSVSQHVHQGFIFNRPVTSLPLFTHFDMLLISFPFIYFI